MLKNWKSCLHLMKRSYLKLQNSLKRVYQQSKPTNCQFQTIQLGHSWNTRFSWLSWAPLPQSLFEVIRIRITAATIIIKVNVSLLIATSLSSANQKNSLLSFAFAFGRLNPVFCYNLLQIQLSIILALFHAS